MIQQWEKIGNIFYSNGLSAITKPSYQNILNPGIGDQDFSLTYQGTHLIYENEYQCMAEQHEFDITLNPSARKTKSKDSEDLANLPQDLILNLMLLQLDYIMMKVNY